MANLDTEWTDADYTNHIMAKQLQLNKTWSQLAENCCSSPIRLLAACMGHRILKGDEADSLQIELGFNTRTRDWLCKPKILRITSAANTSDPIIARFKEAVDMYGPALALLIRERFGDGIMSAVDFSVELRETKTHTGLPATGSRVEIVWSGKFLPYTDF